MSGPLGPARPRWTGPELLVWDGSWRVVIELHTKDPLAEAEEILKRVRWTKAEYYAEAGDLEPKKRWK